MVTVIRWWMPMFIACGLLAGCGLTQTVTDGTISITKSIFYKKNQNVASGFYPAHGH